MVETRWLTACEISKAYAARKLSPLDVTQALLAAIAADGPRVDAFISVDHEAALEAARNAENELSAGRVRSPLHGVPIGIKDIIDVAGLPTTCHSKILLGNIASRDASVISRLRLAGAVILGKLALHEFAIGGPAFDLPFPPARNPWNLDHHPGGSSSGSGAGLAAGFFPLALGTDTGGSIRNPAGACGVMGLKPSYGMVSRRGVFPLAFTLDHVGPMARCVGDIALLLDAIAGHDPGDPGSAVTEERCFGRDLKRGVQSLRIGFVRHFHEVDMLGDPEVVRALEEAARVLQTEGAIVRTVTLPTLQEFGGVQRTIMLAEAWAIHASWLRQRPGDYGAHARRRLMSGAFLSAGEYVQAQQRRSQLMSAVDDVLTDVDVLLTANAMDPPCRIDDAPANARTYPRQARSPFSLTGHPALALMCGLSSSGLPLSMQLIGRAHGEASVLRVAAAFERATDWHTRRAPI